MIIQDGVLSDANIKDLDSDGALHIPEGVQIVASYILTNCPKLKAIYFPESVKKIFENAFNDNKNLETIYFGENTKTLSSESFSGCDNIKIIKVARKWKGNFINFFFYTCNNLQKIIRKNTDGALVEYEIYNFKTHTFLKKSQHNIGDIEVATVQNISFDGDKINGDTFYIIKTPKIGVMEVSLEKALNRAKQLLIIKEFKRQIWLAKTKNNITDDSLNIETILVSALDKTLTTNKISLKKNNYILIKGFFKNLPKYIKYISLMQKKYPNAKQNLDELTDVCLEDLIKIITPKRKSLNKSCTHLLKKHPVSNKEMQNMVSIGFKNPGAFPVSWLRNLPKEKYGDATKKLHNLLKNAASKMYSTSVKSIFPEEMEKLAKNITKIIKQHIEIQYLSAGHFSKTYTLQIPGDKKYVWKIYHCDNGYNYMSSWGHDTELQNSFLLSGKKYTGNIKFRKISTAGISNQRGEIYLIYPFTEDIPKQINIQTKYIKFKRAVVYDENIISNCINRTFIDLGSIHINQERWYQPLPIRKIANTILYHSWKELSYVLTNYSSDQIKSATDFIERNMSKELITEGILNKKINYLKTELQKRIR